MNDLISDIIADLSSAAKKLQIYSATEPEPLMKIMCRMIKKYQSDEISKEEFDITFEWIHQQWILHALRTCPSWSLKARR